MNDGITRVVNDVGFVFRHIFSGVLVVGTAFICRPIWFDGLSRPLSTSDLAILATVALALGNLAYSLNRYGILHYFEFIAFLQSREQDRMPCKCDWEDYTKEVSDEIWKFYRLAECKRGEAVVSLMRFRRSAQTYLLLSGECLVLIALNLCGSVEQVFACLLAIACLTTAIWLVFIDRALVRNLIELR